MTTQTPMTQPWILRLQPNGSAKLRLAVDETLNQGSPIDRTYDLPCASIKGQSVSDQHAMRQGIVRRTDEHVASLASRYPDEAVISFVGNGNLLANYDFVAWQAGQLYRLANELAYKRAYTCIVTWKDGSISIETLWFAREDNRTIVMRKVEGSFQEITNDIEFATSGQPLVQNAQALSLEQIAELWYDTRHLLKPLCLPVNGVTLFLPNTQLQQGLARKALRQAISIKLEAQVDEAVRLPLTMSGWRRLAQGEAEAFARAATFLQEHRILSADEDITQADALLRMAAATDRMLDLGLESAGYELVDSSRELREGEARFINGHMEIFLQKSFYPHNIFVRWADGACGFVVFPGKSGRTGVTLTAAQTFLTETLGVQGALLLDNGGDVRLWHRGQYIVQPSEQREEIRALLAFTAPKEAWLGDTITLR